jgi:hypothetical protein
MTFFDKLRVELTECWLARLISHTCCETSCREECPIFEVCPSFNGYLSEKRALEMLRSKIDPLEDGGTHSGH